MRQKGTERPFTGALVDTHEDGSYHCGACHALLFTSDTKFDSGCGWPSFWLPQSPGAIDEHEDLSLGRRRIEVTCATCARTLATSSPTDRSPPACATASTAPRSPSRKSELQQTRKAPAAMLPAGASCLS